MKFSQRHIAYVINAVILIGIVGLIVISELHSSTETEKSAGDSKHFYGPGDNKQGYDSINYKTNALDLQKQGSPQTAEKLYRQVLQQAVACAHRGGPPQ